MCGVSLIYLTFLTGFAQGGQQALPPVDVDNYKSWIIGIVSGVVAAGISIFIEKVWKALIVPWYEERVYQDARISGAWKADFTNNQGEIEEEKISIASKGHQISGTIVITKGKNEGKVYLFTGNFRNLILVGTYYAKKDYQLDRGSFALHLKKNGTVLEGQCVYYSDKSASINAAPYAWLRESQ